MRFPFRRGVLFRIPKFLTIWTAAIFDVIAMMWFFIQWPTVFSSTRVVCLWDLISTPIYAPHQTIISSRVPFHRSYFNLAPWIQLSTVQSLLTVVKFYLRRIGTLNGPGNYHTLTSIACNPIALWQRPLIFELTRQSVALSELFG